MAKPLPPSADSQNKYEDLSGVNSAAYANPYDALIEASEDDPVSAALSRTNFGLTPLNHKLSKMLFPKTASHGPL